MWVPDRCACGSSEGIEDDEDCEIWKWQKCVLGGIWMCASLPHYMSAVVLLPHTCILFWVHGTNLFRVVTWQHIRPYFKHKRRLQKVFKLVYKFEDEMEPALANGLSVEEVQAFGAGLFVAELWSWADTVIDASANVASAVHACKQHAHYLFNFMPVYASNASDWNDSQ